MLTKHCPLWHRAMAARDTESPVIGECRIDRNHQSPGTAGAERVGTLGSRATLGLTSPALPLARVMAVGEDRRFPLER